MDRKIGLVLASIHTGLSRRVWRGIASNAQAQGDTLFIFPGGRLSCPENYEYLRQIIYPLASSSNLQGLVSWSSTLGGFAPLSEVVSFHQKLDIPLVTFGLEIPGHPFVGFDSYHGIMLAIDHCIKVHGAKRLAFIRGPQNHPGAKERYEGFVHCLEENGIPVDNELVSSPHSWTEGREALLELLDARHLVPGKDFDTIVSSSDMMCFDAGQELVSRGYHVPKDVRLVGLNDSFESIFFRTPLTTVHMPVDEICKLAVDDLVALMEGKKVKEEKVVLPMPLVIRRSCGCPHPFGKETDNLSKNLPAFLDWLGQKFSPEWVDRLVTTVREGGDMEELMYEYLKETEGDCLMAEEAISLYSRLYRDPKTVHALDVALLRAKFRLNNEDRYRSQKRGELLNTLKNLLLCNRFMKEIVPLCQKVLPSLGVPGLYLVLRKNSDSLFVGGFEGSTLMEGETHFPSEQLLPEKIGGSLPKGVYIVEPLFMENQPLGYALLRVDASQCDGLFLEELRTALSSSVKGAFLFDEVCKAKDDAERSERLRSEFLANVNANIRIPFGELIRGAEDPEKKSKMLKIFHLFELALTDVDVDEHAYQLTSYEGLPPVFTEEETMKRIFEAIEECMPQDSMRTQYRATLDGLEITVLPQDGTWDVEGKRGELAMGLAQRLCVSQGGTFLLKEGSVSITLPWPTLSSTSPVVLNRRNGDVWYLAEKDSPLPGLLEGEKLVTFQEFSATPSLLGECALLEIDAQNSSYEHQLALHLLEKLAPAQKIPVLCLHFPTGSNTVIEALKTGDPLLDSHAVAVLGALPEGLEKLALPSDFLHFQDFDSFSALPKPALCVMDHIDVALISAIRGKSQVPILVMQEHFTPEEVEEISSFPGLSIAHTCIAQSDDFLHRVQEIIGGAEMLAPLTGVLVKRGVAYLDAHAPMAISRWQLAEAINVSEDYLTRIFRRDLGLSPWDYLTRLRVDIAKKLLRQSALSVGEVANKAGFQDQAYFCRVFKKATGVNPGKLRQR